MPRRLRTFTLWTGTALCVLIAGKPGAPRRRPQRLYADRTYDSHLHRVLLWCHRIEPLRQYYANGNGR